MSAEQMKKDARLQAVIDTLGFDAGHIQDMFPVYESLEQLLWEAWHLMTHAQRDAFCETRQVQHILNVR